MKIMAQSFFDTRVTPPAVDLCIARQAGTDKVAKVVAGMFLPEFAGEFGTLGPWSDETHVAAKNVPELWKFVQSEPAKTMSRPRAPGIVRNRPDGPEMALGALVHASEFEDRESMTVQSNPGLAIEDGSAIRQTDDSGNQRHQWE